MVGGRSAFASIDSVVCTPQVENTMRFDCTVLLNTNGSVSLGHRAAGEVTWTWVHSPELYPAHGLTAYNLQPGMLYEYRVVDDTGDAVQGLLGTPLLPAGLGDLQLTSSGTPAARYVLFDTAGCDDQRYLLLWDTVGGYISWYHHIEAETLGSDLSAFTHEPSGNVPPGGTILGIVDQRHVYEWNWSGKKEAYYGSASAVDPWPNCGALGLAGPCPHHDVTKDNLGTIWTVTASLEPEVDIGATPWSGVCPIGGGFVNDGLHKIVGGLVFDDDRLMDELLYDPTVYAGPTPEDVGCTTTQYLDTFGRVDVIDWTHVNAIARIGGAEDSLLLSVPELRQVVRYRADIDTVLWTLSSVAAESDLTVELHPDITFAFDELVYPGTQKTEWDFQHDVHVAPGGTIQFFDNHENFSGPSRVVRMQIEPPMARIVASWNLPNQLKYQCNSRGSARTVPGTFIGNPDVNGYGTVMALCAKANEIMELTESDGSQAPPSYTLKLDGDACVGDPDGDGLPETINDGWHRAWPIMGVGQL